MPIQFWLAALWAAGSVVMILALAAAETKQPKKSKPNDHESERKT